MICYLLVVTALAIPSDSAIIVDQGFTRNSVIAQCNQVGSVDEYVLKVNASSLTTARYLDFQECSLKQLPVKFLEKFTATKVIHMANSGVQTIESENFRGNGNLERILAEFNELNRLPAFLFNYTPKISEIDFSCNNIEEIDPNAFAVGVVRLAYIKLSNNRIKTLDGRMFANAVSLTTIDLVYNDIDHFGLRFVGFNCTQPLDSYEESSLNCMTLSYKWKKHLMLIVGRQQPVSTDANKNRYRVNDVAINCGDENQYLHAVNRLFAQSFADDLSVVVIGLFVSTLCELMQTAFTIIEGWCTQHEQTVNTDKTKLMLFTKKKSISGFKPPKIFGKEIYLSQSVTMLGLDLDPKLNWNKHFQRKGQKAIATLWTCRSAIGRNWGISPKIMNWIYTAIVRPRLAYAAFIWWPRLQIGSVQKQLAKIQRLALISITGAMKTTPTAVLEALLNIEPLHIHCESVAKATCIRLHQSSLLIKSNFGHADLWNRMVKDEPRLEMPYDTISPTYVFDKNFRITYPSRESWKNNTAITKDSREAVSMYSDGSKFEDSAGAGIYCDQPQINESVALGSLSTIFQAETFGISRCSEELISRGFKNYIVNICTDSQSALKTIGSYKVYSSLVLECVNKIMTLASENTVNLVWVPGHSGIAGNDAADELAREGATTSPRTPEPVLKVSSSFFKSHLTKWKRLAFKKHWETIDHARQAKNCIKINVKNTRYILSLSRKNIKRLTGVLTGHCAVNKHLYTIGIINDPNCANCGDIETTEHLLCKCPAYIAHRAKSLGAYILPHNIIWSIPPSNILNYLNRIKRI